MDRVKACGLRCRARADAAAFDAWSEVTHLAVMLRQRGMRETGDRFDGIIQMVGSTLHAMQFELDAKNTARPTPELTRRAQRRGARRAISLDAAANQMKGEKEDG